MRDTLQMHPAAIRQMHPARLAAQADYAAALRLSRRMEYRYDHGEIGEMEWAEAEGLLDHCRQRLIEAESAHPTRAEVLREHRRRYLADRGLDP